MPEKLAPTYIGRQAVELLSILLADVVSDIEIVARDTRIPDASFIRCRRALDRVACAQAVLEAMRKNARCSLAEGTGDMLVDAMPGMGRMASWGIRPPAMRVAQDTVHAVEANAEIRTAVELLAKGWPEDYPAGAAEWQLLKVRRPT